jgi:ribosomal protein S12 methylthiotransferase
VAAKLTDLCEGLGELGAWVRLHYVYPYPNVDDLIPLMADGKVLPYLDVPFQHASPKVLKAMKRPAAEAKTLQRIREWRAAVPDLPIRSTFIVGFPGETDKDFELLLDWLEEAELDRVGCFRYEPVRDAAANALPGAVAEEVKEERWHRFMAAQQTISARRLARKVGSEIDVIIDERDGDQAIGRSMADAPEIDGRVYLAAGRAAKIGTLVRARVTSADEYDLWAEPVSGDGVAHAAPRRCRRHARPLNLRPCQRSARRRHVAVLRRGRGRRAGFAARAQPLSWAPCWRSAPSRRSRSRSGGPGIPRAARRTSKPTRKIPAES